jgi:hypothetical protein
MKFVDKAGILGQIAMMFILPGVGGALMKGLGAAFKGVVGATAAGTTTAAATSAATVATGTATTATVGSGTATVAQKGLIKAGEQAAKSLSKQVGKGILKKSAEGVFTATRGTGLLGSSSALANGVGSVLKAAGNFVKVGAKAFSTVTEGVSSFIGEFGKTALNKIPGVNIGSAAPDFATAWSNVQSNVMTNASETVKAFNTSIGYTPPSTGGLANYKPTARVSVDSLKPAQSIKIPEADGGTLTLPAGSDPSQAANIKARALGQLPDGTQMPTVDSEGMLTDPAVGAKPYELPEIKKPNSLLAPKEAAQYKLPGDFQGAMDQTSNFGVSKPPTTNFVAETAGPVAATDPSYYEVLKSKATDALKEFSPSSLLDRVQKIPGEFLDNLGNTITKAPETAFYANLNKQPAPYNVSTQVIGGPMPVADVASLQQPLGTAEQATQYYQGLQRSGNGSYGFASNDGYGQFMKKFG